MNHVGLDLAKLTEGKESIARTKAERTLRFHRYYTKNFCLLEIILVTLFKTCVVILISKASLRSTVWQDPRQCPSCAWEHSPGVQRQNLRNTPRSYRRQIPAFRISASRCL